MNAAIEQLNLNQIVFTDNAASKINQLMNNEENKALRFRIYVTGGGCSGFQYGFKFDEELSDDDTLINNHGIEMVIDYLSFQYLIGSEVDYVEGLQGSKFLVKNPNAIITCGCGFSFSI